VSTVTGTVDTWRIVVFFVVLVLFWKLIILLTVFPIHHNFKKLEIPSGVWNGFGLQMDLDPPLEGRLQEVEEEDIFLF